MPFTLESCRVLLRLCCFPQPLIYHCLPEVPQRSWGQPRKGREMKLLIPKCLDTHLPRTFKTQRDEAAENMQT